ncbi:MAG: hypothetical protein CVU39_00710 [Chloroflexi bacterium HGW-Chloroflexi-10]|nr:MAG: hypothetical protein CVU39_00710 [Chloroflexi bacterium HGW-Chloroflexi-10]
MKVFLKSVILVTLIVMLSVSTRLAFAKQNLAGSVTGLDNLSMTVQEGWRYLDSDVSVSGSDNWSDGYIDIAINSGGDMGDQLRILSSGSLGVSGDAVSWNGNRVGTIDPVRNGVNGQPLRINFSASLLNSGFETGDFSGWSVNNSFSGLPGDTPVGISQTSNVVTSQFFSGTYAAELKINGSVTVGYGTAHGPEITSSVFYAKANDTLTLRWNAVDSGDDYDVYGYLKNSSTGVEQQLFYGRGDNTGGWVTTNASVNSTVCPSGTCSLQFRFLAGTYDATGGMVVGSTMYIDGINVVTDVVTNVIAEYIVEHLEYHNSSNSPVHSKSYTLTLLDNASSGTASATASLSNANTTTTITADSPDPSVYGSNYSVSVSVAAVAPSIGTPDGTVSVSDGTGGSCTITLSGGSGSCSFPSGSLGSKTLSATYNGTALGYNTSSDTEAHTVEKANTTTTITSDTPDPSVYGQNYTINFSVAAVAPGSGTPTGMVTLSDGTNSCGPVTLSGGSGSCGLPSTSPGAKTLTATYSGDANFNGSSDTETHTVNKASATTTITSDGADPSVYGQDYTVNFSVIALAPGSGALEGTVLLSDGTNNCEPVVLSSGSGSCVLPSTSPGVKTLTATYSGDANFYGSSDTENHTVNIADTDIVLSSPYNPSPYGAPLQISATVAAIAPSLATPVGQVQFTLNGENLGSLVDLAAGVATSISLPADQGTYSIGADYLGTTNFNTSIAAPLSQVIEKAPTTTTVISSLNPSIYGQSVMFTATVTANSPSLAIPNGTVQYKLDGINYGAPVTLNGSGVATRTIPFTALWPDVHSITAVYSGAENFLASNNSSNPLDQTVEKAPPIISITPQTNPIVTGQPVDLEIAVAASPAYIGIPTGTVTLLVDDVYYAGPLTLEADGTVTLPDFSALGGSHVFTVQYGGDDYFIGVGSQITDPVVINKASTTTSLSGYTPLDLVVGEATTVSVNVLVAAPGVGIPEGDVTISNGTDSCVATLSAGSGSCALVPSAPGQPNLTATYSGNNHFNGSVSNAIPGPAVIKADTSIITFTTNPQELVVGQPAIVNIVVEVDLPGSGTATGTVEVSNGTNNCQVTLDNGSGTCSFTPTAPGQPDLSAVYSGDTNFNATSSGAVPGPLVNKAETSITAFTYLPTELVVGQPTLVNFSVGVDLPGSGTASGTVIISNGADTCQATLEDGEASCIFSSTMPGQPDLTATYSGDSNFASSNLSIAGPDVTKAESSITSFTYDPAELVVGQPAIVSIEVGIDLPGNGTASGSVEITNGTDSCVATLENGYGSCEFIASAIGQPDLTAAYSGDDHFNPSVSGAITGPLVNKAGTTITSFTYLPEDLVVGQPTTVSVTMAVNQPGSGTVDGTVTISNGFNTCQVTLMGGSGTCELTPTAPGMPDLTASYNGSVNFNPSMAGPITGPDVFKAETSIRDLVYSPETLVVGQPTNITINVGVDEPGSGTATGTVTISNGVDSCLITLENGIGTCSFTATAPGQPDLDASYSGDDNFNPSSAVFSGPSVSKAPTVVVITSSDLESVYGQPVSFTAAVSVGPPGSGLPIGFVQFYLDNALFGDPVALTSGEAHSVSIPGLDIGSHLVRAEYLGDDNFMGEVSENISQTVIPADTSIALVSTRNPAPYGDSVTVIATVTASNPSLATPEGSVQFKVNGVNYGAPIGLNSSGESAKVLPYTALWVGEHQITVVYIPSTRFNASDNLADPLIQVIGLGETEITVEASEELSVLGLPVSFTITVISPVDNFIAPTGSVQMLIDGVLFDGALSLDANGQAVTTTTTSLSVGSHTIIIQYSGDEQYAPHIVEFLDAHTVVRADTTTSITGFDKGEVVTGESYQVSVEVSALSSSYDPGGIVTVSNGVDQCEVTLVNGSGSCALIPSLAGQPPITAIYSSDSNFNSSQDTSESDESPLVGKASTTTTINGFDPLTLVVGQPALVTITVAAAAPSVSIPDGTVTVSNGVDECEVTLVNGAGTCELIPTATGQPNFAAVYAGNSNFNASPAVPIAGPQVAKANTVTTIDGFDPLSVVVGQAVEVAVSVDAETYGDGDPTGTVTVSNGVDDCEISLVSGSGFCTLTLDHVGQPDLTAVYSGDGIYNGSVSASVTGSVFDKADTSILSLSFDPGIVEVGLPTTVNVSAGVDLPGNGVPNGTVTVSNGVDNCEVTLVNGSGTCEFIAHQPGQPNLTTTYNGSLDFNPSSGQFAGPIILRASTTTAISSSNSDSVYGQPVTFTAQVNAITGGIGQPGGSVQFYVDDEPVGAPVALVNGSATSVADVTMTPGIHNVRASYSGDVVFDESLSPDITQTVVSAATTITVVSLDNPITYGESVTVRATVETDDPGYATPAGYVQFKVDGVDYGAPVWLNVSGQAEKVLIYNALWVGTHTVTAYYNYPATGYTPTDHFSASNNALSPESQVVEKAVSVITAIASAEPSVFGQAITFQVNTNNQNILANKPTGTVTVTAGSSALGTFALTNGTAATGTISTLAIGDHDITVVYSGDENYLAGTFVLENEHRVNKASSTTTISSFSPATVELGEPFNVTVNVAAAAPGSGTPGGSVTVYYAADSCTVSSLSAGSGSCAITPTTTAGVNLTAIYAGNADFNESSATPLAGPNVTKGESRIASLTFDPATVVVGQPFDLSVTVEHTLDDSEISSGTVTVTNGVDECDIVFTNGSGTCEFTPTFAADPMSLTASYAGDANYGADLNVAFTGPVVNPAETEIYEVTFNPQSPVMGQMVVITAKVRVKAPGSGIPTGNITITLLNEVVDEAMDSQPNIKDTAADCTVELVNGVGICQIAAPGTGVLQADVEVLGDTNFIGTTTSESFSGPLVIKAHTDVVISGSPLSILGTQAQWTALVSPIAPAGGDPQGNVKFYINGIYNATVPLVNGMASMNTTDLPLGNYVITAEYLGNTDYYGSLSDSWNIQIVFYKIFIPLVIR